MLLFPKVPDQHKPNKPLVPNGLGVIYVLVSSTYLFLMHYFKSFNVEQSNVSPALTLAVCILFGGFMGLLDDWMDLRWRYKAFLPLVASIPLISFATTLELRFVGNTGSFAIGMTLAAFAIIADLKTALLISILPYIVNSSLILLNYFFFRTKANVSFDGKKLFSNHRRSLVTLITYHRPLSERRVVMIISVLVAISTFFAFLVYYFS